MNIPNTNQTNKSIVFTGQDARNMMGYWGEQAYFEFLQKKYELQYKANLDNKSTDNNNFSGCKLIGEKNQAKLSIAIEFKNRGKYQAAIETGVVPAYTKGHYDLTVSKTLLTNNAAIVSKWHGKTKTTNIEVKATKRDIDEENTMNFSGPETKYMFEFDKEQSTSYQIIRIPNAGEPTVNYRKFIAK